MLQLLLWMVIKMVMMGEREQTDKVGSASWDENDGSERTSPPSSLFQFSTNGSFLLQGLS